jgi:hypothetical protein
MCIVFTTRAPCSVVEDDIVEDQVRVDAGVSIGRTWRSTSPLPYPADSSVPWQAEA